MNAEKATSLNEKNITFFKGRFLSVIPKTTAASKSVIENVNA